jgi:hypothetical protein
MYRYVDMLCFPQETFCYVPNLPYVRNFKVRYFGLNAILYELKTIDATFLNTRRIFICGNEGAMRRR